MTGWSGRRDAELLGGGGRHQNGAAVGANRDGAVTSVNRADWAGDF